MGACTFANIVKDPNLERGFDQARAAARAEYGGSYSGSIGEKDSVVKITDTPLSVKDAADLAYKLIDADDPRIDDKWGPAGAIPLEFDDGSRGWYFFGWASS